jgi:hypothetical protein
VTRTVMKTVVHDPVHPVPGTLRCGSACIFFHFSFHLAYLYSPSSCCPSLQLSFIILLMTSVVSPVSIEVCF